MEDLFYWPSVIFQVSYIVTWLISDIILIYFYRLFTAGVIISNRQK